MPQRPDSPRSRGGYRGVADDLRAAMRSGELAPGQLLPTEPALADRYDVSVDVIRSALGMLRGEGLIVTRQGKGSMVRGLVEVTVVRVPPGARITARMPTPEERETLGLPEEGVPVLEIRQGDATPRVLGGDRVAIETVEDEGPERSR